MDSRDNPFPNAFWLDLKVPGFNSNISGILHNAQNLVANFEINGNQGQGHLLRDCLAEREGANDKLREELLKYVSWCQELDRGRLPDGFQEFLEKERQG